MRMNTKITSVIVVNLQLTGKLPRNVQRVRKHSTKTSWKITSIAVAGKQHKDQLVGHELPKNAQRVWKHSMKTSWKITLTNVTGEQHGRH